MSSGVPTHNHGDDPIPARALQSVVVEHIHISADAGASTKVSYVMQFAGTVTHVSIHNRGASAFTAAASVAIGATPIATGTAALAADAVETPAIQNAAVAVGDRIDFNTGDQPTDIGVTIEKPVNVS